MKSKKAPDKAAYMYLYNLNEVKLWRLILRCIKKIFAFLFLKQNKILKIMKESLQKNDSM